MAAATKAEIEAWVRKAAEEGKAYVMIVWDTLDYSDYPVPCDTAKQCDELREVYDDHQNMSKIMECYDLSMDIDEQLNAYRARNFPPKETSDED